MFESVSSKYMPIMKIQQFVMCLNMLFRFSVYYDWKCIGCAEIFLFLYLKCNPNIINEIKTFFFLFLSGQYLAAQMQAANPDLVEQFRQTTSRTFNPNNQDNRGL